MTTPLQEVLSYVGTGNADPILREIHHALKNLVETGETTVIDLGAIPFAAGDERILDSVLVEGELNATLNSLGTSYILETDIPGVWRIDHLNDDNEVQSRFIEVTYFPEILRTQKEDAQIGLQALTDRLQERDSQKKAV